MLFHCFFTESIPETSRQSEIYASDRLTGYGSSCHQRPTAEWRKYHWTELPENSLVKYNCVKASELMLCLLGWEIVRKICLMFSVTITAVSSGLYIQQQVFFIYIYSPGLFKGFNRFIHVVPSCTPLVGSTTTTKWGGVALK